MVRINGVKFPIYQLDTQQSIIRRIAVSLDTIPLYLYFPDGFPENIDSSDNIIVEDVLSHIKERADDGVPFNILLNEIKHKLPKKIDIKNDVLYIWLAYNRKLKEQYKINPLILEIEGSSLVDGNYFNTVKEFERFWENQLENIKADLERKIKNEERENSKIRKLSEEFDKIEEGLAYTEFETNRVNLDMNLDLQNITLLEIFNNAILNEEIPFITCKSYYKILKDFIPPEDWIETNDEYILFKMFEKESVELHKYKEYTNIKLSMSGEIGREEVNVSMKLITERGYLSQKQFIQRFLKIFSHMDKINYSNVKETEVVGVFYFPMETLDSYVFSDLVMNNIFFSMLINIDESTKTTKKKTDVGQPWLHIHFRHPNTGPISASITQKFVDRSDPEMRGKDIEIFEHGQPYIRVRAKGRDLKAIELFQEMFSKLLVIYGENYNEIVDIYKEYIPDFGVLEVAVVEKKKKDVELIAPDVFVKNYSRNCNEMRMPTIITEKEARELEKNRQVMKFPRDIDESGERIPSDGQNQQYYVCNKPDYPYPGLQINKLSNSTEFPYVPCCFKRDQRNKKGGIYRNYFLRESLDAPDKRQQELIITDKFLTTNKFGNLPPKLEQIFNNLDSNADYKYIRVGVARNPSSFLNAVMVALHEQTGILELEDSDEILARVLQVRQEELTKNSIAPLARQCMYDNTSTHIKKLLMDQSVYMNPQEYVQLLEGYYNCNIYIFNREQLILPHHLQSLYKMTNEGNCIFIYEHMGSESDHAKYPQCELIIRWNTKTQSDTQYIFNKKQSIAKKVDTIFKLLKQSYALNNPIAETVFSIPENVQITSQFIDNCGKTRQLTVMYLKQRFTIITSPIPQLAVEEVKESQIHTVPVKNALKLFQELRANITSQTLSPNGNVKEINGISGNVYITIPVIEQSRLPDVVASSNGLHYSESKESAITIYNRNKKLARYICEYMFWLFSTYIHRKNISEITDTVLAKFAKKSTVIIPDFKYGDVQKTFSMDSGLMHKKKLVITSEDMLKRMMYVLKLYTLRNLQKLLNYHKHSVITHYYTDITDFTHIPGQIILYGSDTVDKWIQENKFIYKIHSEISIGQRIPYFFQNELIENGKIFLAQNTENLQKAMDISINWQRNGYNIGAYAEEIDCVYSFTLYNYVNENTITSMKVHGKKQPTEPINIIGYKLIGIPYYTTLLTITN